MKSISNFFSEARTKAGKEAEKKGLVHTGKGYYADNSGSIVAKAEGGEIVCGGMQVARDTDGYYMAPAIVAGTKNSWRINREEMFAPIACVIKVDSYDEALEVVNDTHFGLTSGIITTSLARASDFRRRAETGVVTINLPTAGTDYHVPFGGRGNSSYGPREQGGYAKEFYTTVKTSYTAAGQPD